MVSNIGNAFGFGRSFFVAAVLATAPISSAFAGEWWVGAYGGYNTSFDSDVKVSRGAAAITYRDVSRDGASFEMPPYWGVRGGYWFDGDYANFGMMLDYSHAKVKAPLSGTAIGADFSHFEFTDGLNLLALNGLYRLRLTETFTSYGGLGVGISVPHAEATARFGGAFDGMPRTFAGRWRRPRSVWRQRSRSLFRLLPNISSTTAGTASISTAAEPSTPISAPASSSWA